MKHIYRFFYLLIVLALVPIQSVAEEPTRLRLNWADLNEMLRLDSDEIQITWDEFQKLMHQTGQELEVEVTMTDGLVTLKRQQFRDILSRMKPIAKQPPRPPAEYVITRAEYIGQANSEQVQFTAKFRIFVFERESVKNLSIPLISTGVALSDMTIDGQSARIVSKESWHSVILSEIGYHDVTAQFSTVPLANSVKLGTVTALVNKVDISWPDDNLDLKISPVTHVDVIHSPSGARLTGYMPSSNLINFNWLRKSAPQEKRPARFNAITKTLITADTDIIRTQTDITLEVVQGDLNETSVLIPENYDVVRVEGKALKEWRVRETDIGRVLEIPFLYAQRSIQFEIYADLMLAENTVAASYSGLKVIDAVRESGEIAIIADGSVEVQADGNEELDALEYHQLPNWILSASSKPILFAFSYAKHPFNLNINITKHERMSGISTVIESARATTLFLAEGKLLHHIVYTIRNTYKQFMELQLPDDSTIWTVYVDGKRGKPSQNDRGKILIPLVRSTGNGDQAEAFEVELIYTRPVPAFNWWANYDFTFPECDIFMNKVEMDVYVPPGYRYHFDDGEWEKEALPIPPETFDGNLWGKAFRLLSNINYPNPFEYVLPIGMSSAPDIGVHMEEDQASGMFGVFGSDKDELSQVSQKEEAWVQSSGTTGKIAGRVTDKETGEALVGCNVIVAGTTMGASVGPDGNYFIINVPPGEYEVRASMLGYGSMTQIEVMVRPGYITNLDFELSKGVLEGEEIVIKAKKPLIVRDNTSSVRTVTGSDTEDMPVYDSNAAVTTSSEMPQPKSPSVRGGWANETVYFAAGMPVMTGPVGLSSIKVHLPLSGAQYRFVKKIVGQNETFPLRFSASSLLLRRVLKDAGFILFILAGVWLMGANRGRLCGFGFFWGRFFRALGESLWENYKQAGVRLKELVMAEHSQSPRIDNIRTNFWQTARAVTPAFLKLKTYFLGGIFLVIFAFLTNSILSFYLGGFLLSYGLLWLLGKGIIFLKNR